MLCLFFSFWTLYVALYYNFSFLFLTFILSFFYVCIFRFIKGTIIWCFFFFLKIFFFINILPIKFYISQLYHMLGKFRPDID